MAIVGSISIQMTTQTSKFKKGLASASVDLKAFGAQAASSGRLIAGLFAAAATGAAAYGLAHVAEGAIALGEQTDRARIVFGEFADQVISQSKTAAVAFGVSRKEFIASASAFGTIFEGVGYAQKDAAALALHFTALAGDLSSLVHIPVQEAMEKIQSGLAGQVRPLREVGVFMSDDLVKTYAYTHGIARLNTELNESQKVQARVGFITEKLAVAHGNLAATAGSAGNMVRSLSGRLENLSDTAGTALLSVLGPALDDLTVGVQALQMAWEASALASLSASSGVLGGVHAQATVIGIVQKGIMFLADGWVVVKLAALGVGSVVVPLLTGIVDLIGFFARGVDMISVAFGRAETGAGKFFTSVGKQMDALTKRLDAGFKEGLKDAFEKPPPSVGIATAFDDARKSIAAARAELLKPGNDVSKLLPAAMAAKTTGAPKFANAMEFGSKEAVNTELRSRYGAAASKKPEEQTARNTQAIAKATGQMAGYLGALIGRRLPDNPLAGLF